MEGADADSAAVRSAVEELLHSSRVTVHYGELRVAVPVKDARRALRLLRTLSVQAKKQHTAEAGNRETGDRERTENTPEVDPLRAQTGEAEMDTGKACRTGIQRTQSRYVDSDSRASSRANSREESRADSREESGIDNGEDAARTSTEKTSIARVDAAGAAGAETAEMDTVKMDTVRTEIARAEIARAEIAKTDTRADTEKACRNWTLEVEAVSVERVLDAMPKFKTAFVKQTTPEAPMLEAAVGKFTVHVSLSCSRSTFTQKSLKDGVLLTRAEKRQRLTPNEAHALIGDGYREFAGVAE